MNAITLEASDMQKKQHCKRKSTYPKLDYGCKTDGHMVIILFIGLRGIFVAADGSATEIVDKKAVKGNTTKFNNVEYK